MKTNNYANAPGENRGFRIDLQGVAMSGQTVSRVGLCEMQDKGLNDLGFDIQIDKRTGTGTAGTPVHQDVGMYTVLITLGNTPELEQYSAEGKITIPKYQVGGSPIAGCGPTPSAMVSYAFDPFVASFYAVSISPVTVSSNPLILNSQSYSTADLNINYEILPFSYTAYIAQVDLLNSTPGSGSWLPTMSFVGSTSMTGTATLNKGFQLDATKDYAVQVVLNRGMGSLQITSDTIPVTVAQFYAEKADPQFPDVKLWDKYYPALGTRNIVVHAQAGGVNTPVNAELIGNPEDVSIEDSIVPSNGKAVFHLDGSGITSGAVSNIPIEFSWNVDGQTITDVITYHVEDAYNTDMASVINGDNVFVYDIDHAGLTPTTVAYGSAKGEMVSLLTLY